MKKDIPQLYISENECCGCSACYAVCPVGAISMKLNLKGFYYPYIDAQKCINCKRCLQACTFKLEKKEHSHGNYVDDTYIYAAKMKDRGRLKKSSSGGMFGILSDFILKNGGALACSAYNYKNDSVEFNLIMDTCNRDKAMGSMYIQSALNDIFNVSLQWIKNNPEKKLMFVGMGCQAAAFKHYLESKGYGECAYVIDIICHGYPSLLIWKEYIALLKKKHGSRLTSLTFKDKRYGWRKPAAFAYINGREIAVTSYVKIYLSNLILRSSCYECPYTKVERNTDITIGDFWRIENTLPEFYDSLGNSLVIIHTDRGKNLFEKIKDDLEFTMSDKAACLQPNLCEPTAMPENIEEFWREYQEKGFPYILSRYGRIPLSEKVKTIAKKVIIR